LQATRDRMLSIVQELDAYENENEGKRQGYIFKRKKGERANALTPN
jgi:hypothetical protein